MGEHSRELTLAVVGAGKMGTAVLAGILRGHRDEGPFSYYIACVQSDASVERLQREFKDHVDGEDLTILQNNNVKAFQEADVILLGFKPYMAPSILRATGVRGALEGKLVISLLAGWSSYNLRLQIYKSGDPNDHPEGCSITRATPNMAASIGESMTVIEKSQPALSDGHARITSWIFGQIGQIQHIAPDIFDAASNLVGAGIAFMTIAFEGLLDGSVSEGIKRDEARAMLAQTLMGMARLIAAGEHPAVLREQITSPRGTTIRGLLALEAGNVRSSFSKAIIDATERSRQL